MASYFFPYKVNHTCDRIQKRCIFSVSFKSQSQRAVVQYTYPLVKVWPFHIDLSYGTSFAKGPTIYTAIVKSSRHFSYLRSIIPSPTYAITMTTMRSHGLHAIAASSQVVFVSVARGIGCLEGVVCD
jgi:hypothetical protein